MTTFFRVRPTVVQGPAGEAACLGCGRVFQADMMSIALCIGTSERAEVIGYVNACCMREDARTRFAAAMARHRAEETR